MKKVILVVEDNFDVRENTIEMLELSGYATLSAPNGKNGFEIATVNLPDLILCDISMPDTNGLELFDLLKSNVQTRHIPFIFFSAHSKPVQLIPESVTVGVDYIRKPFTLEELIGVVQTRLK